MKTTIGTKLFSIMPVIVGVLVVFEIISINRFAGSGKEIQSINIQIVSLSDENTRLEERIASYSSFMAITQRADQLGFKQPAPAQYETIVSDQLPVAIRTLQ